MCGFQASHISKYMQKNRMPHYTMKTKLCELRGVALERLSNFTFIRELLHSTSPQGICNYAMVLWSTEHIKSSVHRTEIDYPNICSVRAYRRPSTLAVCSSTETGEFKTVLSIFVFNEHNKDQIRANKTPKFLHFARTDDGESYDIRTLYVTQSTHDSQIT